MHTTVMEWQRALLLRDGKLVKLLEPGRHRHAKKRTSTVTVDMRPRLLQVPGQELLTKDGLALRVSLTVSWTVQDPVLYTTGAQSAEAVLYAAVQEAVRAAVAAATLEELVADRELLSAGLAGRVAAAAESVGAAVTEARARDLMLPGELRRAALETVLAREQGRAELERARAEAASLRSLANTARLLEEHPALLQLRTLQVAAAPGTQLVLDPRPRPE